MECIIVLATDARLLNDCHIKRIIFFLIFAVALCNPVFAMSVEEQLEQHRQWCKFNIPDPEKLNDKQLLEAVASVYMQELNDKEACDIFNAAGKFDPVFSLYGGLLSSKSTDVGYCMEYKSRIRLFELADSLYSDDKCLCTRCGLVAFNAYFLNEQYDEALSLLDNLIERIKSSKLKTKEGGLLCLCRSIRLYTLVISNREYPEVWDEAIQIEKASWAISGCPKIDDWCKSEIHLNLAYMYTVEPIYMQYQCKAFAQICSTVNVYGSYLDYIKPFVNNHLSEVERLYSTLYGAFHPLMKAYNGNKGILYVKMGDLGLIEVELKEINQSMDYLKIYYPHKGANFIFSRLNHLFLNQICQKSPGFDFYILSLFYDMTESAGENDNVRKQYLSNLLSLSYYGDDKSIADKIQGELLRIDSKEHDSYKHLTYMLSQYNYHYFNCQSNQRKFNEFLEELVNYYKENHKTEWKWINLGYWISRYLLNSGADVVLATSVYDTFLEDYAALHGERDIFYSQQKRFYASAYSRFYDNGINLWDDIISLNEQLGTEIDLAHLGKALLLMYTGNLNYALQEFRKARENTEDTRLIALCDIKIASVLFAQGTTEEALKSMAYAVDIVLKDSIDINSMFSDCYVHIADYYIYKNEYDKAERILSKLYQQYLDFNIIDGKFIRTLNLYVPYLVAIRQDLNTAYNVIVNAEDWFNVGQVSVPLLYLQLFKMEILRRISPGDYNRFWPEMARTIEMYNAIQSSSMSPDNSERMEITGMICNAFNNWITLPFIQFTMIYGENEKTGLKIPSGMVKTMYSWLTYINDFFNFVKSFADDDYLNLEYAKRSPSYYQIKSSMALCYESVGDILKASSIFKSLIEDSDNYHFDNEGIIYAYICFLLRNNLFSEMDSLVERLHDFAEYETFNSVDYERLLNGYVLICMYYINTMNFEKAISLALKYRDVIQGIINTNIDDMSRAERTAFLNAYGTGGHLLELILPYAPEELSQEMYNSVLYEKGILVRASDRINKAIHKSTDTTVVRLSNEIAQLKEQLRLYNAQFSNEFCDNIPVLKDYGKMNEHLIVLEKKMSAIAAPLLDEWNTDKYEWQDVRNALNTNEAAIEYVICPDGIYALLLKKDSRVPLCIELTNDEDSLFIQSYTDLYTGNLRQESKCEIIYFNDELKLYDHFWRPLEKELTGVDRCFVSTIGWMNTIALPYIRTEEGGILMDQMDITMLTSTSELPRQRCRQENDKRDIDKYMFNLYGSIYYSDEQAQNIAYEQLNRGAVQEEFPYLSGTYTEIMGIDSILFKSSVNTSQVKLYMGEAATEESFHNIDYTSPNILHLATHGFYVDDVDNLQLISFLQKYNNKNDAMLRTGLAFANSEMTWNGERNIAESEDGIVTSLEIGEMDMHNTDLVVLSACKSGLGDYGRDGIWGLQRGFKQAGVKSIMSTLWSVDDNATCELICDFYRNLLETNDMNGSLKKSVDKMRKKYTNPYYWAPFILLDCVD